MNLHGIDSLSLPAVSSSILPEDFTCIKIECVGVLVVECEVCGFCDWLATYVIHCFRHDSSNLLRWPARVFGDCMTVVFAVSETMHRLCDQCQAGVPLHAEEQAVPQV